MDEEDENGKERGEDNEEGLLLALVEVLLLDSACSRCTCASRGEAVAVLRVPGEGGGIASKLLGERVRATIELESLLQCRVYLSSMKPGVRLT